MLTLVRTLSLLFFSLTLVLSFAWTATPPRDLDQAFSRDFGREFGRDFGNEETPVMSIADLCSLILSTTDSVTTPDDEVTPPSGHAVVAHDANFHPASVEPFSQIVDSLQEAPSAVRFRMLTEFMERLSTEAPSPTIDSERIQKIFTGISVTPYFIKTAIPVQVLDTQDRADLTSRYLQLFDEVTNDHFTLVHAIERREAMSDGRSFEALAQAAESDGIATPLVAARGRGISIRNPALLSEAYELLVSGELFYHLRRWNMLWVTLHFPRLVVHLRVLPEIGFIALIDESKMPSLAERDIALPHKVQMRAFYPAQQIQLARSIRIAHRTFLHKKIGTILSNAGVPNLSELVFGGRETLDWILNAVAHERGLVFSPTNARDDFWERRYPSRGPSRLLRSLRYLQVNHLVLLSDGVVNAKGETVSPQLMRRDRFLELKEKVGLRTFPGSISWAHVQGTDSPLMPQIILQLLRLARR